MRDDEQHETAIADAVMAGRIAVASLPDDELVAVLDEVAALRRRADAALTALAGELSERSSGVPADESVVRAAGHRSVREMVQHRVGVRSREAAVLCTVAEATRARVALSGGTVPARFPHVAAALARGWIAVAQAHAITDTLAQASARIPVDDLDVAERSLVEHACGTSADDVAPMVPEVLTGLARRWIDHLDPDGADPRYDEQVAQRYFRMRTLRDGSTRGEFQCSPDVGAAIQTVFDAEVKPRRVTFDDGCGADDERPEPADVDARPEPAAIDERTPDQRRMDVLAAIVAHHGATESPKVGDEAPLLTITVSEDALHGRTTSLDDRPRLERTGEPVPVSVAASLLCDGVVQAVVRDPDGEPVRLGRRSRLFTRSQRRAIITRDGHCRAPGCTAPPAWCESHHVTWWSNDGHTDVDNGILLCRFHHVEVHRGALVIEAVGHTPDDEVRARRRPRRRWRVAATYRRRPRIRGPLRR